MSLFNRLSSSAPADQPLNEAGPAAGGRRRLGELFRQTRLGYGGDIEAIAAALRIRASYLAAIEQSHYEALPGPVYALGFVRAYAGHLGLDGDEAVRRFKQETSGTDKTRDLSFPAPLAERSIPGGSMVMAALVLAICGYGLYYYLSTGNRSRPERVAAVPQAMLPTPAPEPSQAAAAPATAIPSPVAPPPTPEANAAIPPTAPAAAAPAPVAAVGPDLTQPAPGQHAYGAAGPTRIVIRAVRDSWVQLRGADQATLLERTLHAGDIVRVPDQPGAILRTGNSAGLEILVDGKPVPPINGTIRRFIRLDPARLMAGDADGE